MQAEPAVIQRDLDETLKFTSLSPHRYRRLGYHIAKRAFDLCVALIGIILMLPVYLIISIVIFVQDGGPVIFRQQRLKRNGETFHIFKFRSMVNNAEELLEDSPDLMEEYLKMFKIKRDPRLIKCGQFLRTTSLDELPQLFNVVRGDMSLVGPRPIVNRELANYGQDSDLFLEMKPGCAGLWQCSGRSLTTYEQRIQLDLDYLDKAGFWFDIGILCRTIIAIFRKQGAH